MAGKRKTDNMDATDININMWEEDGRESEPDDTTELDCGAASVVVGTQTLKRYLKVFLMKGLNLENTPVSRCTKGLRFGNGNLNTTKLCALIPTYFRACAEMRSCTSWTVQRLLGRPVLEAFHIAITYSEMTMACGKGAKFEKANLGPKGEYTVHMAECFYRLTLTIMCMSRQP